MRDAWQALKDAGLPSGGARGAPSGRLDEAAVRDALSEVGFQLAHLHDSDRDCLLAWLRAFRHHWPRRFDRVLGPCGEAVLRELEPRLSDANRYLKLRRIAIENLAGVL